MKRLFSVLSTVALALGFSSFAAWAAAKDSDPASDTIKADRAGKSNKEGKSAGQRREPICGGGG
jgi:hypothetical protein